MKDVSLWVHWKQGDDLAHYLKDAKHPVQALRDWADGLSKGVEQIRELAGALEGTEVEIEADTHHIGIHNISDAQIDALEQAGLVHVEELPEDDFEEEI